MKMPGLIYKGVKNIDGPLVFINNISATRNSSLMNALQKVTY